jgi:hypothetical protein
MLDEEMDHMDQVIREAANNHHPAYNDKAWEKMELQLDKHLPQKKDRRRLIFFLLFFLLLGTGTFFVLTNRPGNDKSTAAEKNSGDKKEKGASTAEYVAQNSQTVKEEAQVPVSTDGSSNSDVPVVTENNDKAVTTTGNKPQAQKNDAKGQNSFADRTNNSNDEPNTNKKQITSSKLKPQNNDTKGQNGFADRLNNNDEPDTNNGQITSSKFKPQKKDKKNIYNFTDELNNGNDIPASTGKRKISNKSKTKVKITTTQPIEETQTGEELADKAKPIAGNTDSKLKIAITAPVTETDENTTASVISAENKDKKVTVEETKTNKETVKDSVKPAEDKKLIVENKNPAPPSDKKKSENKFRNNFGLTFSAGPDVSFVKLSNTGKTTLTYGAGISYGFAKRFTARAGFYVSKKVYEATPDQYHTPGGNYPYLTDVDAKCNIYEIPVSLSYSFGQRKKHNWFGSVGLSSFIMKKEDYVYNYKTPTGQTFSYSYAANNENKHYFSVLNLSGGYQYQFNKWLSLQAEPYLQVPLGGVGAGKIKLNSAGILFTVTVKPFARKK